MITSWLMKAARRREVKLSLLLLCMLAAGFRSPASEPPHDELERFRYAQIHMGMETRVVLYAASESAAKRAASAAFERIAALEDVMSSYRSTSELRRLGERSGEPPVRVSEALFTVLDRAQALAHRSGGAFDPTVAPYVALWREARTSGRLPSEAALQHADSLAGWQKIELDAAARTARLAVPGMQIDLGGLAKGYILDQALATLAARGIERALVEAGGDIVVSGPPPGRAGWRVDVPGAGSGGAARTLTLAHRAVSTSGDTQQFVEIAGQRYSHVIDPCTGLGLTSRIAATVVAPNGLTADGLATTVTVLGDERGRAFAESHRDVSVYIRHVSEIPVR